MMAKEELELELERANIEKKGDLLNEGQRDISLGNQRNVVSGGELCSGQPEHSKSMMAKKELHLEVQSSS
jgi:hypothetical protein